MLDAADPPNEPHMTFDLATLMAVGVLTTAVAGVLTLTAWASDRGARALLWWAAAYFAVALGIALLLAAKGDVDSAWTGAGFTLLSLGAASMWTGARRLSDQPPLAAALAAGPLLTFVAAMAQTGGYFAISGVIQFAVSDTYFILTIMTLWSYPRTGLRSAIPLMAFIGLHAAVFLIGLVEALFDLLPQRGLIGFGVLFSVVHFEQLVFAMGSSIFLVALVRERSELRHKTAAAIDTLTGLATRRAFMDKAQRDLVACADRAVPLALIMFDLDHFKSVNDGYGHAAGDQVLQTFARVARGSLRASDFIGRLGGEEFAVVMPGTSPRAARHIANRIRRAFAEIRLERDGRGIRATVSGGIASAEAGVTLEKLLSAADAALYRAKEKGRNRIELADHRGDGHDDTSVVVRVA